MEVRRTTRLRPQAQGLAGPKANATVCISYQAAPQIRQCCPAGIDPPVCRHRAFAPPRLGLAPSQTVLSPAAAPCVAFNALAGTRRVIANPAMHLQAAATPEISGFCVIGGLLPASQELTNPTTQRVRGQCGRHVASAPRWWGEMLLGWRPVQRWSGGIRLIHSECAVMSSKG